jgi:thermitase
MKKLIALLFFLLSLTFIFSTVNCVFALEISPKPSHLPDRLIIKYRDFLHPSERIRLYEKFGDSLIEHLDRLDVDIVNIRGKEMERVIRNYIRDSRVEYIEPDYTAFALEATANDPGIINNLQWGMLKVKAAGEGQNSAWFFSKSNPGVKIAILDTGVDQDHEDLKGKIISNYKCADSPTFDDLYGHGTHVAGIAAASTNNGIGVAGLGYDAALMNVKVLGDDGSGYYSWIADCIRWAADNGAKVINLSLGGSAKSKTLENAVNYAWRKGVVLVGAAGNSGNSSPTYPAYYANMIAVAATDKNDQKASWSSYGKWVDVAAPGVDIYSTFPNHSYKIDKSLGYDYASGTSMATPHVAGLAALIWTSPYGINNSSVRKQIENKAEKITGTGTYWTYGRINALESVSYTSSTPTPTITPSLIPTSTPLPTPKPVLPATPTPTPTPWWCKWFPSRCK